MTGFRRTLVEEHLGPDCAIRWESAEQEVVGTLGRVDPNNNVEETFCMTVIGFKMSRYANAVSNLHGVVSRRMWVLYVARSVREDEVPIGHITNGVHVPGPGLAGQMALLYDKHFPCRLEIAASKIPMCGSAIHRC